MVDGPICESGLGYITSNAKIFRRQKLWRHISWKIIINIEVVSKLEEWEFDINKTSYWIANQVEW